MSTSWKVKRGAYVATPQTSSSAELDPSTLAGCSSALPVTLERRCKDIYFWETVQMKIKNRSSKIKNRSPKIKNQSWRDKNQSFLNKKRMARKLKEARDKNSTNQSAASRTEEKERGTWLEDCA